MTSDTRSRRTDRTPCLLYPAMIARGGGLTRSLQERATLLAGRYERVLVLTTGFAPQTDKVVAELKARGGLDERVEVRNFFAHSRWASRLGVPPAAPHDLGRRGVTTRAQGLQKGRPLRLADTKGSSRFPFQYRYFDTQGRLLLTTRPGPDSKHELRATRPDGTAVSWGRLVATWVDEEMADLTNPVLFSLQRSINDPVLLASRRAALKVASLHNCHYNDPDDRSQGIKASYLPLLSNAAKVDAIVCQTQQQYAELSEDVPGAPLSTIRYPGRRTREEPVSKDTSLVVMVAQLIGRKRVDHAIRAFPRVLAACPDARLEIYGEGPLHDELQQLVSTLDLEASVTLKGYSLGVGEAQARAACTLMTSTFEGSPRVVTESLSRGTAVVAYDIRYGPRDLIRDGVDGMLVGAHEPEALADAIVAVVADPARALEMGERASEIHERAPLEAFEQAWGEVVAAPVRRRTLGTRLGEVAEDLRESRTSQRLRRVPRGAGRRLRALQRLAQDRLAQRLRPRGESQDDPSDEDLTRAELAGDGVAYEGIDADGLYTVDDSGWLESEGGTSGRRKRHAEAA
jgi:glycosyltransferase involved in cell wall biosynthesis